MLTAGTDTEPARPSAGPINDPAVKLQASSGRYQLAKTQFMERRGKSEVYLHFVWATYRRMPLITPQIEQHVYASIIGEAEDLNCEVLAIGGVADHVHLAVDLPPKLAPSKLMQQVKGVSSAVGRKHVESGGFFGWQDGYGVYSFSTSHQARVVAYIRNQKKHHAEGSVWQQWEMAGGCR